MKIKCVKCKDDFEDYTPVWKASHRTVCDRCQREYNLLINRARYKKKLKRS